MSDTPSVSTLQVIDQRIEPQPDPVYLNVVGPDQNQFYKIPASAVSDSYVAFNNLTTLGKDRAYLDTFELEISVDITYATGADGGWIPPPHGCFMPVSFPFNSVCEQARININGGAFFNSPLSTIRAKERYWDEKKLQESFANHTPCCKPYLQDEAGRPGIMGYDDVITQTQGLYRSRMFGNQKGYGSRSTGPSGNTNFAFEGNYVPTAVASDTATWTWTWREPIFCSPFSSRYDATYGRPLYNITSIDLAFNLADLRNMFLSANISCMNYEVHIKDVQLCYQVLTVSAPINHAFTVVPYRRYVPYITDIQGPNPDGSFPGTQITQNVRATSGVYTLNEVPTAIWVFMAPALAEYQRFQFSPITAQNQFFKAVATNNKLFGFMKHISISCGNTTQILNTASVYDLYRIAKANGCKDNFEDWSSADPFDTCSHLVDDGNGGVTMSPATPLNIPGCGSVLRLIPGVDIVLPEQKLIPGSNANNLVFQVEATFDFNGLGNTDRKMALWLLFEYVGVASITPGNCVVTMNPLGSGAVMAAAPTVSADDVAPEPTSSTEGSGVWDDIANFGRRVIRGVGNAARAVYDWGREHQGAIPGMLRQIPGNFGQVAAQMATSAGLGYKRARDDIYNNDAVNGGAVMGLGDFC